ncbi:MAG: carboxypeptidase regulatory-like domain-containing protein [Calothrix sp. MO_167.B42]|nr:carboxypeptidase regulatory-like domain-containing protein [Calothrix sp. MO_167.B42]
MSQSPSISYTGRIIDQRRQAPISGAKVSFNSEEISIFTYTDIEGIYRLFINSTDTNALQGELIVEAEGYRNYQYPIQLSPEQTELRDIRLLGVDEEDSNSNSWLEWDVESSNLLPIVIVATIALFTIVILILNAAPRRNPEYRRDDSPRYFQSFELIVDS